MLPEQPQLFAEMVAGSGFSETIPVCKLDPIQRKDVQISIALNILIGSLFFSPLLQENKIMLVICLFLYAITIALIFLFNIWSVRYQLFTSYKKQDNVTAASYIYIKAEKFHGKSVIVPLRECEFEHGRVKYFLFQKIRFFNVPNTNLFFKYKYGKDSLLEKMISPPGIQTKEDIDVLTKKYGDNSMVLDVPSFKELLIERIYSPLFVFQIFCCLLWCLDEYWYYSLFTLVMLVFFEGVVVFQQRTNMSFIRKMQNPSSSLYVFRENKWTLMDDKSLLPGDIISLKHSINSNENDNNLKTICPCDVILLNGSCLVDESSLTGESVPQLKEPIEKHFYTEQFKIEHIPKVNVISCGTSILHSSGLKQNLIKKVINPPDHGSLALCVRTGFSTSKGRLLRTIMYSVNHVPNNNLETALFLVFLSIFACIASGYVWMEGIKDPSRSRYKLLLECVLILTSVVPPELPIELSLAVNNSMIKLIAKNIYCTEPYRIPFAGKLSVCCFDKTGTLTEDNLVIEGVVVASELDNVIPLSELADMSLSVIVGCHSLTSLNSVIVGDPIEKNALDTLKAKFTGADCISFDHKQIQVVKRFPFSSKLKRMSALICMSGDNMGKILPSNGEILTDSSRHYFYAIKGAPETLHSMIKAPPSNFEDVYKSLTKNGYRVLALGYRYLPDFKSDTIHLANRDDSETDITFTGFLVARCSLKPDAVSSIKEIKYSGHRVTMITGDNPLTACYVAKATKMITDNQHIYMLTRPVLEGDPKGFYWEQFTCQQQSFLQSPSIIPFDQTQISLPIESVLCVCGDGLRFLMNTPAHCEWLKANILKVAVWARVDPEEKEIIIKLFKTLNYSTLMCGDGTNDMGALRQSCVGVAMLNNTSINKDSVLLKGSMKPKMGPDYSINTALKRPTLHRNKNQQKLNQPTTVSHACEQVSSNQPKSSAPKTLKEALQAIEKDQLANGSLVKLGDASIAAPFTLKSGNLSSVCDIINQGRCTLVTTLQMFRILAINSLISAYSQSVHYSHGIRMGDYQSTMHALIVTFSFFFVSNTEAAPRLTRNIPLFNIFNIYMILSVTLQSVIHLCSMLLISHYALHSVYKSLKFDIDSKFEPNILNSVMFITTIVLQVTTFAVNYHGRPFMKSFWNHKKLRNSILATYFFVVVVLFEWIPELNKNMQIVPINRDIRSNVLIILMGDVFLTVLVDRLLYAFMGEQKIN